MMSSDFSPLDLSAVMLFFICQLKSSVDEFADTMKSDSGSIHQAIFTLHLTSSTKKYNNLSLQSNFVANPSVAMVQSFIPAVLQLSISAV
eukprot:11505175-Ditylum_brightwellii.AAC.1